MILSPCLLFLEALKEFHGRPVHMPTMLCVAMEFPPQPQSWTLQTSLCSISLSASRIFSYRPELKLISCVPEPHQTPRVP